MGEKLAQFAQSRRGIARVMAQRFKFEVPSEVECFFDAVEAGRWEEAKTSFASLRQRRDEGHGTNELSQLWGPVLETFGVAQVAHAWPADQLLGYGQAVLDSLRPGMVYVGGTDAGRFIPTLLNETSAGERHMVLTQNALTDNNYLQYLDVLYGDRLNTLSAEDSQHAYENYLADAQKRLLHDQQSPNEPRQLMPGEDVKMVDGHVQVSGQVGVMCVAEKLFQTFLDKNPDISFALEESFPFKSTYANAVPLGPVMELRVADPQRAFTADAAAQAVSYWTDAAQQLLADPETPVGSDARGAYSKLIVSQAHLLADHSFNQQAEQAYQIATQLAPAGPEAVFGYINLLLTQQRPAEALPVAESAAQAAPDNEQFRMLVQNLKGAISRR